MKINKKKEKEIWERPSIYNLSFKKTEDGSIPGLEEATDGDVDVTSSIR